MANAAKTKMLNLVFALLGGVTDIGTSYIEDIDDSVFADPSSASNEDTRRLCMFYPEALQQAIRDIQPKFARRYADLGMAIKITEDGANGTLFYRGAWNYIFQCPSDFLDLISQLSEADFRRTYPADVVTAHTWSHVVKGTDEQAWYCSTLHTAADANKPISGGSYSTYWSLFNTDEAYGADWETGKAYLASSDLKLLLSNNYGNANGNGAFIEYMAYEVLGVGDVPTAYDKHFTTAFTVLLASMAAPVSTAKKVRDELKVEYERLSKPQAIARDAKPDFEETPISWLDARIR